MRLSILAVGKIKERGIREAIDDYIGRVARHFPIDEIEVRDAPPAALGATLERRLSSPGHVVALDVAGKAMSSDGFARWLDARMTQGKGKVVFVIGGAEGLPEPIRARADEKLSLSAMTLPHRLARLFLAEQLYRAVTILRNEPYAR
ncbi:MAG TPA: 23S rRNA (pseudouridine(1915)-N(3))-methyltransferase RlmH [Polyangiaceae bacterium]|nr:23S rRNA (pseudouridine(1915)-N(3))-methyltransferase RlmH [Polyangiaceae bacterium]